MKRKLLTALLTAAMLMTLTPTAALAAEPGDGLESGNGAVVTDSEPGEENENENTPGSEPGEENGDENTPGSEPGEENGDENTPGSEPGEENGDENTPGSEPGEENGDNVTPTQQPSRAPTVAEATNDMMDWDALVEAINGESTTITLEGDVSREDSEKEIVISQGKTVTINLNGYTLNGGGQGPVITVEEGGKLTIEDASIDRDGKITGGEADYGGGIYVDGGTLIMEGGAISGNEAKNGGGVYLTNGATFTMTGGEISENSLTNTSGKGGGVYVGTDCTFTINAEALGDAVIKDNVALGKTVTDGTWNYIHTHGGGVAVNKGTLNFTNALITGNRATGENGYGGGGIYASDSKVTIVNSKISDNSGFPSETNLLTEAGGGGINACNDTVLEMTGTEVSRNVGLMGAGIYLNSIASAEIVDCVITGNKAQKDLTSTSYYNSSLGGGILYRSSGGVIAPPELGGDDDDEPAPAPEYALTITNSTISGNTAAEGGGGICVYGGTMKVENNTTIEKNESPQGGGVWVTGEKYNVSVVLDDTNILENKSTGVAGGIGVIGGTLVLTDCTVQSNEAPTQGYHGGGVYVGGYLDNDVVEKEGMLTLNNTAVSQNKAENGYGGGVFVDAGGTLEIQNGSSISGNTATNAGGVWMQGDQVTLTGNSSISDNTATGEAGGVAVISGTFTMESGEISGNSTPGMGGGVENLGTFTMNGGTITDNHATSDTDGIGGGVANGPGGTFTMTGGAIYGNTAATGGNDFYNYAEEDDDGQGGGIDVDDSWEGDHNMGLESLSAPRAGDTYGTFTLVEAETFGYDGWYNDAPDARYADTDNPTEYEVTADNTSLQYLTLGEPLTAYHVVYAFVSADKNAALPDEVTALLPVDNNTYAEDATVNALQPGEITVTVDGVTWRFVGYDEDSQVVNDDNLVRLFHCNGEDRYISFVGTWTTKEENGEP